MQATKNVVENNFLVTGTITITNPNGTAVGFDVSDQLDDGTIASVDCDPGATGNQTSGTVPANGSVECTYTASPANDDATSNNVLVTSKDPNVPGAAALAPVSWNANVSGDESVTLEDPRFSYSQTINTTTEFTEPETFTCSNDPADYTNGSRTDTYTNVATLTGPNNNLTRNASVVVDCTLPPGKLSVIKFYDANANGINDAGEQLIQGWKVSVAGPNSFSHVGFTTLNLIGLTFGEYTATEANSSAGTWLNTTPKSQSVELTQANPEGLIEFGNVCLGAGGGKTLGFWSNKNGQAQMNDGGTMAPELQMLRGLNLRNANDSNFDPTSYSQFRTWLLNGNATNMNYMLSVQLAATALNVEAGFVSGDALVYAPGVNSTSDYVTINTLANKANNALETTVGGRAYKEVLKNALDSANNNRNFVQQNPCNFRF